MDAAAPAERFDAWLEGEDRAAPEARTETPPHSDEALLRRLTRERLLARDRAAGPAVAPRIRIRPGR